MKLYLQNDVGIYYESFFEKLSIYNRKYQLIIQKINVSIDLSRELNLQCANRSSENINMVPYGVVILVFTSFFYSSVQGEIFHRNIPYHTCIRLLIQNI